MVRSSVAWLQFLLILAGLFCPPGARLLVCRHTGNIRPVTAVTSYRSCCGAETALTAGTARAAFQDSGCCELRESQRPHLPSTTAATLEEASVAVLFTRIEVPVPAVVSLSLVSHTADKAIAPRGPPSGTPPLRAPPFVS